MADYNPKLTTEELQAEIWKPIPGFEHFYEVSNMGRVRGVRRNRLRSPNLTVKGYLHIALFCYGERFKPIAIHRLVAWAFIGPQKSGIVVNHLDGNPQNNRLSNLEYCTRKQDTQHAIRMGLKPIGSRHWSRLHPEWRAHGEGHGCATITDVQAKQIKQLLKAGLGPTAVARIIGCSVKVAKDISCNKTWRHVTL